MNNTSETTLKGKVRASLKSFFVFPVAPRKHFRRLLATMLVLGAAAVALHVYIFYRVESHTAFVPDTTTPSTVPVVNEKKLTKVLSRYADRAIIRDAAATIVPAVPDPGK